MKKVKRNKRNKALVGAILASAGIGALTNLITSGISAYNQRKQFEENNRQALLQDKLNNAFRAQQSRTSAMNSNIAEENEYNKTGSISTLNSAMKCGGKKRMKRAGGTIISDLHKLSLYI